MIKAIETRYNGYRFRSRLEARWAVFFDTLGIKYEYEKEGYDLDGVWYLPDFWLPELECWIEVKGKKPNDDEVSKAYLLCAGLKQNVLLFWGTPGIPVIGARRPPASLLDGSAAIMIGVDIISGAVGFDNRLWAWAFSEEKDIIALWPLYVGEATKQDALLDWLENLIQMQEDMGKKLGYRPRYLFVPTFIGGFVICPYIGAGRIHDHPKIRKAYTAARSARFEHGEHP